MILAIRTGLGALWKRAFQEALQIARGAVVEEGNNEVRRSGLAPPTGVSLCNPVCKEFVIGEGRILAIAGDRCEQFHDPRPVISQPLLDDSTVSHVVRKVLLPEKIEQGPALAAQRVSMMRLFRWVTTFEIV